MEAGDGVRPRWLPHGCVMAVRKPGRRPRISGSVGAAQRGCRGMRRRDRRGMQSSLVVGGGASLSGLLLLSLHGRIDLRAKALHRRWSAPTTAALSGVVLLLDGVVVKLSILTDVSGSKISG